MNIAMKKVILYRIKIASDALEDFLLQRSMKQDSVYFSDIAFYQDGIVHEIRQNHAVKFCFGALVLTPTRGDSKLYFHAGNFDFLF